MKYIQFKIIKGSKTPNSTENRIRFMIQYTMPNDTSHVGHTFFGAVVASVASVTYSTSFQIISVLPTKSPVVRILF